MADEFVQDIQKQIEAKEKHKEVLLGELEKVEKEIETLKEEFLKSRLKTEIPQWPLLKIKNIQIKLQPTGEWSVFYTHVGYAEEALYDYKRYPFIESTVDIDDNDASDYSDTEYEPYHEQPSEEKKNLVTTNVELSFIRQNKYLLKVNGERSRFAIFTIDGNLVVHNLDYKFDLSRKAQQELIKNYTYVDDIPEAVALAIVKIIIEKGWSPQIELKETL